MLKKSITYTDFDDVERTEDFWFALSKPELMEMDFSTTGGMQKMIEKIVNTQDTKRIIEVFKDLILKSYGEKSADGKRFEKIRDGHKLAEDFSQTAAYEVLFMELATDDKAATEFINGIIPSSLRDEIAKENAGIA